MDKDNTSPFINYTKEAFLWPIHLIGLTLGTLVTGAVFAALKYFLHTDAWFLLYFLAGFEFIYLGLAPRSRKFRAAINSRYAEALNNFERMKNITEAYNSLSAGSQRRFEAFRELIKKARNAYNSISANFSDVIASYGDKLEDMQSEFARLLVTVEKANKTMEGETPEKIQQQIAAIREGMANDNPQLKAVKESRIQLLENRLESLNRMKERVAVIETQLHTMEDMVRFFLEQPVREQSIRHDVQAIDKVMVETRDLHTTLTEIEDIMTEARGLPPVQN